MYVKVKKSQKVFFNLTHPQICKINVHQIVLYEHKSSQMSLISRDEFELEFSGSSEPELWRFRAEPSRAGALQFSSWNRADNTYNMYVKK